MAVAREKRVIFVKRKTGYLHYRDDPKGLRSILSRSFPQGSKRPMLPSRLFSQPGSFPCLKQPISVDMEDRSERNRLNLEFISSFSDDPHILAFANHFCSDTDDDDQKAGVSEFCTSVLYECLTREKPEMLRTYLSIYQLLQQLPVQETSLGLWNLVLVQAYYKGVSSSKLSADWTSEPLLQPEFLASVDLAVGKFFASLNFAENLTDYVLDGFAAVRPDVIPVPSATLSSPSSSVSASVSSSSFTTSPSSRLFGGYLIFHEIPNPINIRNKFDTISMIVTNMSSNPSVSSTSRPPTSTKKARLVDRSPATVSSRAKDDDKKSKTRPGSAVPSQLLNLKKGALYPLFAMMFPGLPTSSFPSLFSVFIAHQTHQHSERD